MSQEKHNPEEIAAKLRKADELLSQRGAPETSPGQGVRCLQPCASGAGAMDAYLGCREG